MSGELPLNPCPTIEEAIAAKYCEPHYITLFEVRDSTGFDSSRSADALSLGIYRSRGRELTGFEIKKSRADWLREFKRPEKAEEIGKFCDFFFLVTADDSVARLDEIPGPWGWMVMKGEKLKLLKKPDRIKPVPLDRHMLCSLLFTLRKDCYASVERQIASTVSERMEQEQRSLQYRAEDGHKKYEELRKSVQEFETASGVHISNHWADRPKIGAAVARLLKDDRTLTEYKRELEFVINRARTLAEKFERELASVIADEGGHS